MVMGSMLTLHPEASTVVSVDCQQKILSIVADSDTLAPRAANFVRVARLLEVPVVRVEQNPSRLGPTVPELAQAIGDAEPIAKMTFSLFRTPEAEKAVKDAATGQGKQLVLFGVEAHVCVLQSALDALALGYDVFVPADLCSSVNTADWDFAMRRMCHAGIVVTTAQAAAFEFVGSADNPRFREAQPFLKQL